MFFLKVRPKKKKSKEIVTRDDIHTIVKEELSAFGLEQKKTNDEEQQRLLKKRKWDNLPKSKKLQLLRYLEKKRGG